MDAYFAVDIETTGLDVDDDSILEISVVILDKDNLKEIVTPATFILAHNKDHIGRYNFAVIERHSKNGLWKESNKVYETLIKDSGIVGPQQYCVEEVESRIIDKIEYVKKFGYTKFIPFGNTVSFDVKFIKAYMEELASELHYGVTDVSSVERFLVEIFSQENLPTKASNDNHRAAQDILDSIENYRNYREFIKSMSGATNAD